MKADIINSIEDLEKFKNYKNKIIKFEESVIFKIDIFLERIWDIKAGGSIKARGSIKAGWHIEARGSIEANGSIEADGSIKAGWYIKARGSIKAGWHIEARGSIEANGSIEAGWHIEARGSIKAGGHIKTDGYIFSFNFDISAIWISTKTLPFFRRFWAEMRPLAKFKNRILNKEICWNDLKSLPTEEEKKEIVSWKGWHPILKGQLECFLGLKDKFILPKNAG